VGANLARAGLLVVFPVVAAITLGRPHAGETVTVEATDTQLRITCGDQTRTVMRTNTNPVNWIKAHRPRKRSDPARITP